MSAGVTVAIGAWVHLAATFDGTTRRFYVNGTEFTTSMGAVEFDASALVIGGDDDGTFGFATDGLIDEVRVYDRALDPAEVQTITSLP